MKALSTKYFGSMLIQLFIFLQVYVQTNLDWIWRDDIQRPSKYMEKNLENFEYTHVKHIHVTDIHI